MHGLVYGEDNSRPIIQVKQKLRALKRAGEAASPQFPINENERSCTSWITGVGVRGKARIRIEQVDSRGRQ